MTATLILESLAKQFSAEPAAIQAVFEMADAGLSVPFIGRFRRDRTGGLTENQIRKLLHSRTAFEELDRRRGTILRTLERMELPEAALDAVRNCSDRFEIEDLFVPHRRPEPEVQLALDRGLGALADELLKPVPRSERRTPQDSSDREGESSESAPSAAPDADAAPSPEASSPESASPESASPESASPESASPESASPESASPESASPESASPESASPESASGDTAPIEAVVDGTPSNETPDEQPAAATAPSAATDAPAAAESASAEPPAEAPVEPAPEAPQPAEAGVAEPPSAPAQEGSAKPDPASTAAKPAPTAKPTPAAKPAPASAVAGPRIAGLSSSIVVTPELARICAPYVNPDKGLHTEAEVLSGAVRILSDRLGRSAELRGLVRRMLRKRGVLRVKPLVDPSKAGRHKGLLKLNTPLKGLQGHRLLALRAAQKERVLGVAVELDPGAAQSKVRQHLGKHTRPELEPLLREVSRQALETRLMPVVEADVRLELKERGDAEALRFLSQHLRQLLMTPAMGFKPVIGVDVNAKGDWTLAAVDADGAVTKLERIEVGEKDDATLAKELGEFGQGTGAYVAAVGHGKGPRAGGQRLRAVARAGGFDLGVTLVNEAGLSSYANSELARKELDGSTVPQRMAISIARRVQDPMAEFLKVDPRHLGLGAEQGLVSKANLSRVLSEMVESSVAFVGCDLKRSPEVVLRNMPGLDQEAVTRLLAARAEGRLTTREALRTDALLDEAQWTSSVAFLRLPGSEEPLDRTSLHPEQYDLARRLLESAGSSAEDSLGRPGVTKGLKRSAFEVDEATWRDLMRELSFPGRDPRARLRVPEFLDPATDVTRLTKDRVVEGVVTAVASFGAFVDIGLPGDAMIHISQISSRYVRDARELLSIGQSVRAKIVDPSGPRMALTLKEVPPPERRPRTSGGGGRSGGREGRGGGGRGPRQRDARAEFLNRGDARGMPLGDGRGRSRRGPGQNQGDRDNRRDGKADRVDLARINSTSKGGSYTPFADFFKKPSTEAEETKE